MALIDVTITKVGSACQVSPSPARLTTAVDDIRWINQTGGKVIVFFPHDQVLGTDDHFHQSIADTKKHVRTGPDTGTTKTTYKYAIFCHVTKTFATGSDPEIIVQ